MRQLIANQVVEMGQLGCTPSVLANVPENVIVDCIIRHLQGDWGDVCVDDKVTNNRALMAGRRVLSKYLTKCGYIYIVTEADRSSTTVLFQSEY